jgi:hypothetical protein
MATYRDIVKAANKLLLGSEIGQQEHVLAFWKNLEWLEHKKQVLSSSGNFMPCPTPPPRRA